MIVDIFRDKKSLPFLSFIVGMGIAIMLFHKPVYAESMLAVPVSEVEGEVFSYNGKCYQYHAEDAECEILSSK